MNAQLTEHHKQVAEFKRTYWAQRVEEARQALDVYIAERAARRCEDITVETAPYARGIYVRCALLINGKRVRFYYVGRWKQA